MLRSAGSRIRPSTSRILRTPTSPSAGLRGFSPSIASRTMTSQPGLAALTHAVSGLVQAEQDPALDVGGGLGSVDVLARLVLPHGSAGERQRLAAFVADGHHEPSLEEVLASSPDQAGRHRVRDRMAPLAQERGEAGAAGGVPKAEPPGRVLPDLAPLQEVTTRLA